jgi:hypothetical protein
MPITYTIAPADGHLTETWTGRVTIDVLRDYWRVMLADPEAMRLRATLVDLRRAELALTGDELDDAIRDVALPMLQGRDWRTALVVADPIQFGVSRQYQVFASRYSNDAIFTDIDAARAWLLAGAPPAV